MKTRLIYSIITSLLDEAIIVALIIWGLPKLGIHIPLWGIIFVAAAFVIWAVFCYIVGTQTLLKKPLAGMTDMIGTEGRVVTPLAPKGFVKIKGELWEATSENGALPAGTVVVVIEQAGLKIKVRIKIDNDLSVRNISP